MRTPRPHADARTALAAFHLCLLAVACTTQGTTHTTGQFRAGLDAYVDDSEAGAESAPSAGAQPAVPRLIVRDVARGPKAMLLAARIEARAAPGWKAQERQPRGFADGADRFVALAPDATLPKHGLRLSPDGSVLVAVDDDRLDLYRIADGHLMGRVLAAGGGAAIAFLDGGAVDLRGTVPDGTLFCRNDLVLGPWQPCEERFVVPGALDDPLRGETPFLKAP